MSEMLWSAACLAVRQQAARLVTEGCGTAILTSWQEWRHRESVQDEGRRASEMSPRVCGLLLECR